MGEIKKVTIQGNNLTFDVQMTGVDFNIRHGNEMHTENYASKNYVDNQLLNVHKKDQDVILDSEEASPEEPLTASEKVIWRGQKFEETEGESESTFYNYINRSSFPEDATGYGVYTFDLGDFSGEGNIYATEKNHLQINTGRKPMIRNTTPTPKPISEINVTMPGSGTPRSLQLRLSKNTPCDNDNNIGDLTEAQVFETNNGTLFFDINPMSGYRFFQLVPGGNTNYNEIEIGIKDASGESKNLDFAGYVNEEGSFVVQKVAENGEMIPGGLEIGKDGRIVNTLYYNTKFYKLNYYGGSTEPIAMLNQINDIGPASKVFGISYRLREYSFILHFKATEAFDILIYDGNGGVFDDIYIDAGKHTLYFYFRDENQNDITGDNDLLDYTMIIKLDGIEKIRQVRGSGIFLDIDTNFIDYNTPEDKPYITNLKIYG